MNIKKANIYDIILCIYVFAAVVTDTGSAAMKLARLALVGVWGLRILFEKTVKITPYLVRMVVFWLFATLTVLWAESTDYAANMSKTLLINIVCMCAVANLINHREYRTDLILKTMIIAPLFLELRVILAGGLFAFLDSRGVGTINGNTVGLCGAFGACLAVYYWIQRTDRKKYALLFAANSLIVVLSASKKALLCIAIPVMILFALNRKSSDLKKLIKCASLPLAALVGLVMIMKIPFLYSLIGHRVEGLFATLAGDMSNADGSSQARSLLIVRGMEWFRERPLLGYGIDNYRVVLVKNYPEWPITYYAHNNYVELLVDTGIIGFLLYYWNYAAISARFIRYRNRMNNGDLVMAGMFAALIINEYALVSYYHKYVQLLLLMIWCCTQKLKDKGRSVVRNAGSS